jgi:proline iminopeptidase
VLRIVTSPSAAERRRPHPAIEPYATGVLDVADGHAIAWELSGNPRGWPAVVLHGGPGGGRTPDHRRLFDPARWRVLLFDQRGCGGSRPHASLKANTTWHLVADIERLREMAGAERWLVLGGSWGCALALAYAQTYPERVSALVLRGVFTGRQCEVAWLVSDGAPRFFPEQWEHLVALVPDEGHQDILGAYRMLLTSPDRGVRLVAARRWCRWERAISVLSAAEPAHPDPVDEDAALALAEISVHYFAHGCFLREGQLLADAGRLAGIPGVLVQGRYDAVTPPRTAFELHRAWPGSELIIVSDAGHASSEPGLTHSLLTATDRLAEHARE